ncbi:MAG: hypothetical protein R3Y64_10990, partial [Peptostreptococcaceae bacterium]
MYIRNEKEFIETNLFGYKQLFRNSNQNQAILESQVAKLVVNGRVDDFDMKILELLFRHGILSPRQALKYMKLTKNNELMSIKDKEIHDSEDDFDSHALREVEQSLRKLSANKLINQFNLVNEDEDIFNDNALSFYCLDNGGKILLHNYLSHIHDVVCWTTARNFKSSQSIKHEYNIAEFNLTLLAQLGKDLSRFSLNPQRGTHGINFIPSFDFSVEF